MKAKKQEKGIFSLPIFKTRITTANVTLKEMALGYLIGPFGVLILSASLAAFLNRFYTDCLGLSGAFLAIFPLVSTILVVAANVIMGSIIDKTKTSQGKARPYILLAAPLMVFAGILIFTVPTSNKLVESIWIVVSYNLFYAGACAIYSMGHSMMVPLSTRNVQQRGQLSVFSNSAAIGATGLFASILLPLIIVSNIESQSRWILIMGALAIVAFAGMLTEYFFTRERITEENLKLNIEEEKTSTIKQLKAVAGDKYWWLIIVFVLIFQFGLVIKNLSLSYYCGSVLGDPKGIVQSTLALISGLPMVVGMFAIWPLANKFGKKDVLIGGFFISVIGGIICIMFPTNLVIVIIGQTIKGLGGVPGTYILVALLADILDHLEAKFGFRCDGLTMSIYTAIGIASSGVCMSIFNLMLSAGGYNGLLTTQPDSAKTVIMIGFVGVELVGHAVLAVLLIFITVEKYIKKEQQQIVERQKAAVIASGVEWVEPAERLRIEQAQAEDEAEEARKQDLKEYCKKKGIFYETEEARYQKKKADIILKAEARVAKRRK